jgi:hypothetical protein
MLGGFELALVGLAAVGAGAAAVRSSAFPCCSIALPVAATAIYGGYFPVNNAMPSA